MPSIQVTGQLVDPTTGVEGSADIRIASLINYGQTTKKSISHKSTDASGNYDFQLVHGKHLILVKFDGEQIYNRIGYAVVGDSTPDPIDLIQLINLSDENPPSELVTELQQLREDTLNDIVSTSAEVLENAGYKGLWPDTGGSALKGETWQTQIGGTPTGKYYTALQNTSVDPVGDNVNWKRNGDINRENLSDYTDIVYKASGGNSAVENMIAGIPVAAKVGDTCLVGGTVFERVSDSAGDLSDFQSLSSNRGNAFDFKYDGSDESGKLQSLFELNTDSTTGVELESGEIAIADSAITNSSSNANTQKISGAHRSKSILKALFDGVMVYARSRLNVSEISLTSDVTGTGVGIGTSDSFQSQQSQVEKSIITGKRFGVWKRFSLWDSYRDLQFSSNTCSIKLDRAPFDAGNSNANSPGGWNQQTGWFHNALSLDQVYCEGGEVGIWACSMSTTYNAITCQNQNTDGTSNSVLPDGYKGTGLFLYSGSSGGSRDGWNNLIQSYYSEFNQVGIRLENQKYTMVNSSFIQGRFPGDTSESAMIVDNSYTDVNGLVTVDYFENIVQATNNSFVVLNRRTGATVTTGEDFVVDATSKIKLRGQRDIGKHEYSFDKSLGVASVTYVLDATVPVGGYANLWFAGQYDGYDERFGKLEIFNRQSNTATATVWTSSSSGYDTAPTQIDVLVSNSGTVTITVSGNQRYVGTFLLDIVGGVNVSGTNRALVGV